jgi:hypothetical protein
MAHYLIASKRNDDLSLLTLVEAKNIQKAIEALDLSEGDSVTVYRVHDVGRKVTVKTETIRRVMVE